MYVALRTSARTIRGVLWVLPGFRDYQILSSHLDLLHVVSSWNPRPLVDVVASAPSEKHLRPYDLVLSANVLDLSGNWSSSFSVDEAVPRVAAHPDRRPRNVGTSPV